MTNPFDGKVCEVCSAPATLALADMREVPSETIWRCWEVKERHLFCEGHKRRPHRHLLDGTIEEGVLV